MTRWAKRRHSGDSTPLALEEAGTDPASPLRQDIAASPLLPDQQVSLSLVLHLDGSIIARKSLEQRLLEGLAAATAPEPAGLFAYQGRAAQLPAVVPVISLVVGGLSPVFSAHQDEHAIGLALEDPQDRAVEGNRLPLLAVIVVSVFGREAGKPDSTSFQDDAAQQRPAAALPSAGTVIDRRDDRFVEVSPADHALRADVPTGRAYRPEAIVRIAHASRVPGAQQHVPAVVGEGHVNIVGIEGDLLVMPRLPVPPRDPAGAVAEHGPDVAVAVADGRAGDDLVGFPVPRFLPRSGSALSGTEHQDGAIGGRVDFAALPLDKEPDHAGGNALCRAEDLGTVAVTSGQGLAVGNQPVGTVGRQDVIGGTGPPCRQ